MRLLGKLSSTQSQLTKAERKSNNFDRVRAIIEKPDRECLISIKDCEDFTLAITYKAKYDVSSLKSFEYNGYVLENRQNITAVSRLVCNVHKNRIDSGLHLFIEDFKVFSELWNKGIGSDMISELKRQAKKLRASYISGRLSFVDIGTENSRTQEQEINKERLRHFYSKHGFVIDEEKIYCMCEESDE